MSYSLKSRFYENYTAHALPYSSAPKASLGQWISYYRAHYLRFLPADKASRILDIGCGYGRLLYFLEQEGYYNVYGIDISQEQTEIARNLGLKNIQCISAFDFLADKHAFYDTIILLDVLEHFNKKAIIELLDKVFLSSKPGAAIILQVPNALTPLSIYAHEDFTHETVFTPASLRQVLKIVGYQNIQTRPIVPHIHGPMSLAINLSWRLLWQNLIRLYMFSANGNLMGDIYTSNFLAIGEKPQ